MTSAPYCSAGDASARTAPVVPPAAQIKATVVGVITPKDLKKRLAKKEPVLVLDVRPELEFRAAHISGAVSAPLEVLDSKAAGFSAAKAIVICDRLPQRSRKAASRLAAAGLEVYDLSGGLAVWVAKGYPVSTGKEDAL